MERAVSDECQLLAIRGKSDVCLVSGVISHWQDALFIQLQEIQITGERNENGLAVRCPVVLGNAFMRKPQAFPTCLLFDRKFPRVKLIGTCKNRLFTSGEFELPEVQCISLRAAARVFSRQIGESRSVR